MSKTVQIPKQLLADLYNYHILGARGAGLEQAIHRGLETKMNALIKHDQYGRAVRGDEQARRDYLDSIGMHPDWR